MKLEDVAESVEGELLQRPKTPKADQIGRFFAREAMKRFGSVGTKEDPVARAKQMAGNFYQAMLAAIDDEFNMYKITVRK